MRFTLRQLEVFLAVARDESVSKAATSLAMSQSAVSGSLADLEGQFDVQLFDRLGKRLRLSALGRSVRPGAEAALDQARAFEHDLTNRRDTARLRLGATLTIGNHLAPPLMARFMSEHPGAEVTLAIGNTEEIARQVVNFEIDVGLIEGELEHADLDVTPWREDQLVVFCAPGHPLARKRALTDDVRERGSGTRQTFDRAMHGLVANLHIALELEQTEAIKSAVEAGLGIGCVSPITLDDALKTSRVKICKVPHRDFRRQFFFVIHKQKYRGVGIQQWLELCRRA
jgi:DNA-binding transcriptional LysR family regulator